MSDKTCKGDATAESASHLALLIADSSVARNTCFDPSQRSSQLQVGLREDWTRATRTLQVPPETSDAWYERLWIFHTEPWRHYHTAVHLEEMLLYMALLREHSQFVMATPNDEPAIVLAIFFHDAIYNPKSATNEHDSAKLFCEFATETGIVTTHSALVATVERLILSTHKHCVSPDNPCALALFLDLDMAVLGKQATAYQAYAGLIRKEYSFVNRDEYCRKRAQVLELFLAEECIYGTPVMKQALEASARRNLRQEIGALRSGIIYGEE